MQKIGAYLLERRDGMDVATARAVEASSIRQIISDWLQSKGATPDATSGRYRPEDGSQGTIWREQAEDGSRSWSLVRLDEVNQDGRKVSATISVTSADDRVAVYATLEAGSDTSHITPIQLDSRCPRVIRTLLERPGRWYHGSSGLRTLTKAVGFEQGEIVAHEIVSHDRSVPILIVTADQKEVALPGLDDRLGYDLAGLANVVWLDSDATWALTDHLGTSFSCYAGAVRLYWPRFSNRDDPFRHPLWTAPRLRSIDADPIKSRDRFRKQMRSLLMRAAAFSVARPLDIDEIRNAASRRAFTEMQARASSVEDFRALADSYAADNDSLRVENVALQQRTRELEAQIAEFEGQRAALLTRIENAELQLRYRHAAGDEIAPDKVEDTKEEVAPPALGEVRFYKKHFAAPGHDMMRRVIDCGCNNWEPAFKAEKAKKGILRLENKVEFKSIQHCASCDGGGMWKVKW